MTNDTETIPTETISEAYNEAYAEVIPETCTYTEAADYGTQQQRSVFVDRDANRWLEDAASRPDPVNLWNGLWYEGEVACLFADTNTGKSILAVQIASEIAARHKVLYFDFEMSDKQFQLRYTDPETGALHGFPPNLIRVEYSQSARMLCNVNDIIDQIVLVCMRNKASKVILDNISWICNRSESGDAAGLLMQRLVEVKKRFGLSILVLAHTPKRNMSAPLSQNSLAGSKKLANFFDAIFAIGIDRNNRPAGRYLKQIKVRTGELRYGDDNVIVYQLRKEGAFLGFEQTGYDWERNMLDEPDADDIERDSARDEIIRRLREGQSYRTICSEMNTSTRKISKIVKEMRQE